MTRFPISCACMISHEVSEHVVSWAVGAWSRAVVSSSSVQWQMFQIVCHRNRARAPKFLYQADPLPVPNCGNDICSTHLAQLSAP